MNIIKNTNLNNNSEEVSAIALLKILYNGKIIIFFSVIITAIIGVTYFFNKNLNQEFSTDLLIIEKAYHDSSFDNLKKIKLQTEVMIDEINKASRGSEIVENNVEFLTISPSIYFRNLESEMSKGSFLPKELIDEALSFRFDESNGTIKFNYSFKNKEQFGLLTTFLSDNAQNLKDKFLGDVDLSFFYLENFIKSKIKEEKYVLKKYQFLLRTNKEVFLDNIKNYDDTRYSSILHRLNDYLYDSIIEINNNSNMPDRIKKEILDNRFSDLKDLKRKYDAILSLELPMLNFYPKLMEIQNNLSIFRNDIILMINKTNFIDVVEKDIIKQNQVNLIVVALISILLGFSLGIIIILFRHSIKT